MRPDDVRPLLLSWTSHYVDSRSAAARAARCQFHRVAVGGPLDSSAAIISTWRWPNTSSRRSASWSRVSGPCWSARVGAVKETLLGPDAPETLTVNLPGAGARLLGGGTHVEVTRQEGLRRVVEGFLPRVGLDEKPISRRSGFQEFGLPFAPDGGHHSLPGGLLDRTSPRSHRRERGTIGPRFGPGPTWCCSTAGCLSRRCSGRLLEVLEVGSNDGRATAGGFAESLAPNHPGPTIGSTWPWPGGRPTTAWCGRGQACGSPPIGPHVLHRGGNLRQRRPRPHPPDRKSGGVLQDSRPLVCWPCVFCRRESSRDTTFAHPAAVRPPGLRSRPSFRCSSPARG